MTFWNVELSNIFNLCLENDWNGKSILTFFCRLICLFIQLTNHCSSRIQHEQAWTQLYWRLKYVNAETGYIKINTSWQILSVHCVNKIQQLPSTCCRWIWVHDWSAKEHLRSCEVTSDGCESFLSGSPNVAVFFWFEAAEWYISSGRKWIYEYFSCLFSSSAHF